MGSISRAVIFQNLLWARFLRGNREFVSLLLAPWQILIYLPQHGRRKFGWTRGRLLFHLRGICRQPFSHCPTKTQPKSFDWGEVNNSTIFHFRDRPSIICLIVWERDYGVLGKAFNFTFEVRDPLLPPISRQILRRAFIKIWKRGILSRQQPTSFESPTILNLNLSPSWWFPFLFIPIKGNRKNINRFYLFLFFCFFN